MICEVEAEDMHDGRVVDDVGAGNVGADEEERRFHLSMAASRDKNGNMLPLPLNVPTTTDT